MGTKKIVGCLAKFWVNGHYLSEKCRKCCDFMSLWPCLVWNIFSNGIKVIIYAYAHMIIDYYDLKMIFEIFELIKSLKFKKIGRYWRKQDPFTENFAKEPNIFFVPKVLRIIFYP